MVTDRTQPADRSGREPALDEIPAWGTPPPPPPQDRSPRRRTSRNWGLAALLLVAAGALLVVGAKALRGDQGFTAAERATKVSTPEPALSSTGGSLTASPTPQMPSYSSEVTDQRSLAALVAFLESTHNERIRLDVTITSWAQGGTEGNSGTKGQVLGWIGDPSCELHGVQPDRTSCYGFDVFMIGQRPADLENGFWWLGHDRWVIRGSFFNLGGTSQVGTEWGLQIVRSPVVT